jgi:hypothetical protein
MKHIKNLIDYWSYSDMATDYYDFVKYLRLHGEICAGDQSRKIERNVFSYTYHTSGVVDCGISISFGDEKLVWIDSHDSSIIDEVRKKYGDIVWRCLIKDLQSIGGEIEIDKMLEDEIVKKKQLELRNKIEAVINERCN